jgi:catechol 2,3-dioxygenase-like lactoylglutathione lyase family enzyme
VSEIAPRSLDHVALWVPEREPLASFLCDHLGMHVIERTDDFTLVGSDARRGKLTLFAAEGPRERGALERVVLRTRDLERALARLPDGLGRSPTGEGVAFDAPQGLPLGLVAGGGSVDYDLDHIVLRVTEPEGAAAELASLGFERRDGRLAVADKHLRLEPGTPARSGPPLLNHIALLVDSAEAVRAEAERRGLRARVKDAPNTLAVFVRGPDDIELEYVEHKPGFALV